MRLYIDTSTGALVTGPLNLQRVDTLNFRRGDSARIEVQFVSGGVVVELATGTTGTFGLKEVGKYDGDYVVSDSSWVKTGSGTSTVYTFEPSFNTTELNALLGHNPPTTANDVASVTLMGEIEWVDGSTITSTVQFSAVVANDINKGVEGVPTSANPGYWNKDEAELRFIRNRYDLTALTGGSGALDGVVTTTMTVGTIYGLVISGQLGFWQLTAGTSAEAAPGIIRPDDFNASTNAKVWIQVL